MVPPAVSEVVRVGPWWRIGWSDKGVEGRTSEAVQKLFIGWKQPPSWWTHVFDSRNGMEMVNALSWSYI